MSPSHRVDLSVVMVAGGAGGGPFHELGRIPPNEFETNYYGQTVSAATAATHNPEPA